MKIYCEKCQKEFKEKLKSCPDCGKKLKVILSEQEKEQKEIQKQNDDFTVINTLLM